MRVSCARSACASCNFTLRFVWVGGWDTGSGRVGLWHGFPVCVRWLLKFGGRTRETSAVPPCPVPPRQTPPRLTTYHDPQPFSRRT